MSIDSHACAERDRFAVCGSNCLTDSAENLARAAHGLNIQPPRRSPRQFLTVKSFLTVNFFSAGLLFTFLMTLSGCSVWNMVDRTLHRELVQYPRTTEGHRSLRTYRQWAKQAWQEHELHGASTTSSEYRRGFIDGFVDYVDAGGSGEPPAIPPRRFWRVDYRSNAGDLAIRQWGDGFRAGATAARSGGYRQRAVLPANVPNVEDQLAHGQIAQGQLPHGQLAHAQPLTQTGPMTPQPLHKPQGSTATLPAMPQPAANSPATAPVSPANSRPVPAVAVTPESAKSALVRTAPTQAAPDKTVPPQAAPAKTAAAKSPAKPSPAKPSPAKRSAATSSPATSSPARALAGTPRSPKSAPAQPASSQPAPALASILQQPDPPAAAAHAEETPFQDQLTLAVADLVGSQTEGSSSGPAMTERPVAKPTRDDRPRPDSVLSAESTDISSISVDLSGAPPKPVRSLEELAQRNPAQRNPADPPRGPAPQAVDASELSPSPPWLSAGETSDAPPASAEATPADPAPATPVRPATPKAAPISPALAEGPPVPPGWSEAPVEASPFQDSTSESGR